MKRKGQINMSETFNLDKALKAVEAFNNAALTAYDRQVAAAKVIVQEFGAFKLFYGNQCKQGDFAACLGWAPGHLSKVLTIGRADDKVVAAYRKSVQDPTVWDLYETKLAKSSKRSGSSSWNAATVAARIGKGLTKAQRKALAEALLAL